MKATQCPHCGGLVHGHDHKGRTPMDVHLQACPAMARKEKK